MSRLPTTDMTRDSDEHMCSILAMDLSLLLVTAHDIAAATRKDRILAIAYRDYYVMHTGLDYQQIPYFPTIGDKSNSVSKMVMGPADYHTKHTTSKVVKEIA